ncbi:MAG: hypothetical protein E7256_09520 [Lachnospiraceae bacterium]|nr:hypothetical protein [Lachnospiraceae bacterium]
MSMAMSVIAVLIFKLKRKEVETFIWKIMKGYGILARKGRFLKKRVITVIEAYKILVLKLAI